MAKDVKYIRELNFKVRDAFWSRVTPPPAHIHAGYDALKQLRTWRAGVDSGWTKDEAYLCNWMIWAWFDWYDNVEAGWKEAWS